MNEKQPRFKREASRVIDTNSFVRSEVRLAAGGKWLENIVDRLLAHMTVEEAQAALRRELGADPNNPKLKVLVNLFDNDASRLTQRRLLRPLNQGSGGINWSAGYKELPNAVKTPNGKWAHLMQWIADLRGRSPEAIGEIADRPVAGLGVPSPYVEGLASLTPYVEGLGVEPDYVAGLKRRGFNTMIKPIPRKEYLADLAKPPAMRKYEVMDPTLFNEKVPATGNVTRAQFNADQASPNPKYTVLDPRKVNEIAPVTEPVTRAQFNADQASPNPKYTVIDSAKADAKVPLSKPITLGEWINRPSDYEVIDPVANNSSLQDITNLVTNKHNYDARVNTWSKIPAAAAAGMAAIPAAGILGTAFNAGSHMSTPSAPSIGMLLNNPHDPNSMIGNSSVPGTGPGQTGFGGPSSAGSPAPGGYTYTDPSSGHVTTGLSKEMAEALQSGKGRPAPNRFVSPSGEPQMPQPPPGNNQEMPTVNDGPGQALRFAQAMPGAPVPAAPMSAPPEATPENMFAALTPPPDLRVVFHDVMHLLGRDRDPNHISDFAESQAAMTYLDQQMPRVQAFDQQAANLENMTRNVGQETVTAALKDIFAGREVSAQVLDAIQHGLGTARDFLQNQVGVADDQGNSKMDNGASTHEAPENVISDNQEAAQQQLATYGWDQATTTAVMQRLMSSASITQEQIGPFLQAVSQAAMQGNTTPQQALPAAEAIFIRNHYDLPRTQAQLNTIAKYAGQYPQLGIFNIAQAAATNKSFMPQLTSLRLAMYDPSDPGHSLNSTQDLAQAMIGIVVPSLPLGQQLNKAAKAHQQMLQAKLSAQLDFAKVKAVYRAEADKYLTGVFKALQGNLPGYVNSAVFQKLYGGLRAVATAFSMWHSIGQSLGMGAGGASSASPGQGFIGQPRMAATRMAQAPGGIITPPPGTDGDTSGAASIETGGAFSENTNQGAPPAPYNQAVQQSGPDQNMYADLQAQMAQFQTICQNFDQYERIINQSMTMGASFQSGQSTDSATNYAQNPQIEQMSQAANALATQGIGLGNTILQMMNIIQGKGDPTMQAAGPLLQRQRLYVQAKMTTLTQGSVRAFDMHVLGPIYNELSVWEPRLESQKQMLETFNDGGMDASMAFPIVQDYTNVARYLSELHNSAANAYANAAQNNAQLGEMARVRIAYHVKLARQYQMDAATVNRKYMGNLFGKSVNSPINNLMTASRKGTRFLSAQTSGSVAGSAPPPKDDAIIDYYDRLYGDDPNKPNSGADGYGEAFRPENADKPTKDLTPRHPKRFKSLEEKIHLNP